jgi:hypothetical protein
MLRTVVGGSMAYARPITFKTDNGSSNGSLTQSLDHRLAELSFAAPNHPLGNANDVSTLLADSINQLRRGQLDPRVANAMGYLATVLWRARRNRVRSGQRGVSSNSGDAGGIS